MCSFRLTLRSRMVLLMPYNDADVLGLCLVKECVPSPKNVWVKDYSCHRIIS